MNITGREVMQKPVKAKPNLKHLDRVRSLPCVICEEWGLPQMSPTAAHHPIHGRYGNRKTPDEMAIPLCEGHHQGNLDTTKIALHREPAKWRRLYGNDFDWISWVEDRLA
jgi:hypothetical protein